MSIFMIAAVIGAVLLIVATEISIARSARNADKETATMPALWTAPPPAAPVSHHAQYQAVERAFDERAAELGAPTTCRACGGRQTDCPVCEGYGSEALANLMHHFQREASRA